MAHNSQSMLYSRITTELHLQFVDPSTIKLYNVLKRGYPKRFKGDKMMLLNEISSACDNSHMFSKIALTFEVCFLDDTKFNKITGLDVFYLERSPVFQTVDYGTKFSAAQLISEEDRQINWNEFLLAWVTYYMGYPSTMRTDLGSCFTSDSSTQSCRKTGIELEHTGTDSHNSLDQGKTYHDMLRRVFQKVSATFVHSPKEVRIALFVETINDFAGRHGLVSSLIFFGTLLRILGTGMFRPTEVMRLNALEVKKGEYSWLIAQARVQTALRKKPARSAPYRFRPGQPEFV